jgi:hypothetical protein
MSSKKDISSLIGQKYNRLTIIIDCGNPSLHREVLARCECGVVKQYKLNNIVKGITTSCGCFLKEIMSVSKKIHGLCKHPLYKVWNGMLDRCYNKNSKDYPRYGGRGVAVSIRWRKDFQAFYDWAIDKWKVGLQLDKDIRSDKKVGDLYCPELCCFVTVKENNNQKSNNVFVSHNGEIKSVSEWAHDVGMGVSTLDFRIKKGWSIEKAIETPPRKKRK